MTFAGTLKSLRKQAGMSQEQLAEKLSVSRQAVTKWETEADISDAETERHPQRAGHLHRLSRTSVPPKHS